MTQSAPEDDCTDSILLELFRKSLAIGPRWPMPAQSIGYRFILGPYAS